MCKTYISSNRIYLRPFTESDTADVYSYRSLESVAKYQYWNPFTREDTVAFIRENTNSSLEARNTWIGLAIVDRSNDKLIGDCALRINEADAEIGCNISPLYQQKSYAKEAISLLCTFVFENTAVVEVFAVTDADNLASVSLLKAIGMHKDNKFEEKMICKGVLSIEHKYVIKRSEWVARQV